MSNPDYTPKYVEVVLPLALANTLTYILPADIADKVSVGSRVIVPVKDKFYTGIVISFPVNVDAGLQLKEVTFLLDPRPVVTAPQLRLWDWLRNYYLCSLGEVYRAAIPSGLKIESETVFDVDPETGPETLTALDEAATELFLLLKSKGKPMSAAELQKETGNDRIARRLERLLEEGAIRVSEKLAEKYHARTITVVTPKMDTRSAAMLVAGKEAQENVLLALEQLRRDKKDITPEVLAAKAGLSTLSTIKTMEKKGILALERKEINRFSFSGEISPELPELSAPQAEALENILARWNEKPVVLLHGVTSSGKTEIYIHLISKVIKKGQRVFFLVPEIALTTQLTSRLQKYFGDNVVIYHSKFSDSERVDVWKKLLTTSDPCVIVGARSAVFLPFMNLGAVIVDEEHETSFKQADPAPRYNARDVAIVLASMYGAKTLLGSATPSIETRYKAENGKFGYVSLTQRYGNLPLPEVIVADIAAERRNKTYRAPFTLELIRQTNSALANGNQAIFFLNRRGFAPVARCTACDWSPRCPNCDVAMTYHKTRQLLECHYCGSVQTLPVVCPQCGEPKVEVYGFGTERIEIALNENFEGKKIMRMDLDTTRNKDGHQRIINTFSKGGADILVGTQMVTKGLDFGKVSVVGVINSDGLLNLPDFRASERAFNMLEQVAGRAGRREGESGKVVIQTSRPDHPVIKAVAAHDYEGYYRREIEERRQFNFPPFCRIISVTIKHRDADTVHSAALTIANELTRLLGSRVHGPLAPVVSRIQNFFIRNIMIKIENTVSISQVKDILRGVHTSVIEQNRNLRSIIVQYDVDPV